MGVVFLLLLVFHVNLCKSILDAEYDHKTALEGSKSFRFYWSVDRNQETVRFAVEVQTIGWIGVGFTTQSGKMKGSDVVIGWVKDGKGYLTDRYADDYTTPVLDQHQDYELTGFSEKDWTTILKFKRKIDTCDERDVKLEEGLVTLIYAYSYEDPKSMMELTKHSFKDQHILNLLNSFKGRAPTEDLKYFDVRNKKVHIPSKPTTYWCQPIKLPQLQKKQHVIKITPLIDNGHKGLVHHMVIYICDNDFDEVALNQANDCFHPRLPEAVDSCGLRPVLMAWAMGVMDFVYPENVGFSVGAITDPKFVLLSTHFNNPHNRTDYVDNSGLRFYYDEPRKYNAGILMAGCMVKNSILIPPRQREWVITCYCPKQCTKKGLSHTSSKEEGINVFAVALHAHSAGRRLRTRHFRNGRELPDIVYNNNFDVKHQNILYLQKEVKILPGDDIVPECVYNTMDRKEITEGGHGARKEMCLNFIMYYPQSNLTVCLMENQKLSQWFKQHVEVHQQSEPISSNVKIEELEAQYGTPKSLIAHCMSQTALSILSVPTPRISSHLLQKNRSST